MQYTLQAAHKQLTRPSDEWCAKRDLHVFGSRQQLADHSCKDTSPSPFGKITLQPVETPADDPSTVAKHISTPGKRRQLCGEWTKGRKLLLCKADRLAVAGPQLLCTKQSQRERLLKLRGCLATQSPTAPAQPDCSIVTRKPNSKRPKNQTSTEQQHQCLVANGEPETADSAKCITPYKSYRGQTLGRMVQRFREAPPLSRQERLARESSDEHSGPHFWWLEVCRDAPDHAQCKSASVLCFDPSMNG